MIHILKYVFLSLTKFKVVDLAEKSNNPTAGHKFSVTEKHVQDWQKQSKKIKDLPKTTCADHLSNFLY